MAKLYFKYGVMGAAKTAMALITKYRYESTRMRCILVKPDAENRDGERIIKSRIGLSSQCILMSELESTVNDMIDVIIVDEAQFLTEKEVDYLSDIVDNMNIPVICYGLKTDFRTKMFEGSKRLFEIADELEEVKTVCSCGKRAIINARIDEDGKVVTEGNVIELGGDLKYKSLCRKHYKYMLKNTWQKK